MVNFFTAVMVCGSLNVICLSKTLTLPQLNENEQLCQAVNGELEVCKSQAHKIYQPLNKNEIDYD